MQKILISLKDYISISFWLLCCCLLIRFYEAILLTYYQGYFGQHLWWNIQGILNDILIFLKLSCCTVPIFLIFSFFSRKIAHIFFRIIFMLMILLSLICVTFFAISGYFLDTTVFAYSFKEILDIIGSSTQAPFWGYISIILLPLLFFLLSGKKFRIPNIVVGFFIAVMVISLFISTDMSKRDASAYVKVNKEYFFWKSILSKKKYINITQHAQLDEVTKEYRSYFPQYRFKESKYPFLHEADYEDVLSPYFHMNETPPNIVLILIEGFSQEVLDPRYELMPFFDSLSQQGISWQHCWATSERTFGAFPALFGALPLGKRGFMALSPYTPTYHSLLKIMGKNGYKNAFYYGGWYGFDNMENFMKENEVECPLTNWDPDIEEESLGIFWGKEDHLMFRQAIRCINFNDPQPRMDIYLTLSSHDPWVYPDMESRQSNFENYIKNHANITADEKKPLLQNKNVFAAFNYVDDALEQLINEYRTKTGFENTIFVITGDHSPLVKQLRGPINFHVPFLIWSPMLKEPKNIQGVVTHSDFTPTILSLLQNKYYFDVPQEVAWLNSSMDTSKTSSAKTFTPFYSSDRDLIGVLHNNYFLCNNILYQYQENNLLPIENNQKKDELERLISMHISLNDYIYKNDALIKTSDRELEMNKVWIDESDTIAPDSYFSKKMGLSIIKGPKNDSEALFFNENNEYINLLSYKIENDNIAAFRVEIEFDIYIENDSPESIYVSRELKKKNSNALQDELKYECINRWEHYNYSYTFRKERYNFSKGDKYVVYIWNPKKLKGYLDNIKIRCIYEDNNI